jgi:hypothetical protein
LCGLGRGCDTKRGSAGGSAEGEVLVCLFLGLPVFTREAVGALGGFIIPCLRLLGADGEALTALGPGSIPGKG